MKTGVGRDQIVLINALGTHRPSPPEELVEFLGEEIVRNYRIVQHDCKDRSTMLCAGRLSNGQELWANRDYLQASRRMLTGFIEPHFSLASAGAANSCCPGLQAWTM
ncbi:MAG: nickel-dependent lactate racemase [Firmicutes bacterium]|nr:nickel-dependent lactate racemase [Bacillota bacterium]